MERDASFAERLAEAFPSGRLYSFASNEGNEGLKKIFDLLPHLVIIGITLTGIDGYGILEKKQAEPMLAKIPVFLLSMQGEPIDMRRVPSSSVSEFIAGIHSDPALIVEKVNRAFGYESAAMAAAASAAEIRFQECQGHPLGRGRQTDRQRAFEEIDFVRLLSLPCQEWSGSARPSEGFSA